MRRKMIALDRKLGRIWSRTGGTIMVLIGIFAAISVVESDGFAWASHWPGLVISALFLLAGLVCFRSRAGLIDTLSDNSPERRR